jgi:hypothetical protein
MEAKTTSGEKSLLEEAVIRYHPLRIFLKEYLSPYNLCLLRMTCQTLRSLLAVPRTKGKKKVFLVNASLLSGDFHVAAWCLDENFPIKPLKTSVKEIFTICKESNSQEAQKEIIEQFERKKSQHTTFCAEMNNFPLLKWMIGEGFATNSINILTSAAFHGNIEMFDFVVSCNELVDEPQKNQVFYAASKGGHIEMMKKLIALGHKPASEHLNLAIAHNQLPLVLWLQGEYKIHPDENSASAACSSQSVPMIKLLMEQGYVNKRNLDHRISAGAVLIRHREIELLKWAHFKGLQFTPDESETAARMGDFDTLKWLFENKCPFGETLTEAAKIGNFSMFKWAHENNAPAHYHFHKDNYYLSVARYGDCKFLQYLIDNNLDISFSRYTGASCTAALGGHLDAVKWFVRHSPPFEMPCKTTVLNAVIAHSLSTLQYLIQIRTPYDFNACMKLAEEKGYQNIVDFFNNEAQNPTWVVEEIVEKNSAGRYLVKWLGKLSSENSWVTEDDLKWCYNVRNMLWNFENPGKKKRKVTK